MIGGSVSAILVITEADQSASPADENLEFSLIDRSGYVCAPSTFNAPEVLDLTCQSRQRLVAGAEEPLDERLVGVSSALVSNWTEVNTPEGLTLLHYFAGLQVHFFFSHSAYWVIWMTLLWSASRVDTSFRAIRSWHACQPILGSFIHGFYISYT